MVRIVVLSTGIAPAKDIMVRADKFTGLTFSLNCKLCVALIRGENRYATVLAFFFSVS